MKNGITFRTEPVDDRRLPEGQAAWVEALLSQYLLLLQGLTEDERDVYRRIWKQMARHNAPVVVRSVVQAGQSAARLQQITTTLNDHKLLWFDEDLRAVLQCPPFSVLHTPHDVKAFGWDRSYTCCFVDMPLTLLVYGPNVWLSCTSKCPRSGEPLAFRVRMGEDHRLESELPLNDWQIWLPVSAGTEANSYQEFHRARPRVNAFFSRSDLETHCQYSGAVPGMIYTLPQALYLSECLLKAYRYVVE